MTDAPWLTDVQTVTANGVLTIRYLWDGGPLPQVGPVSFITSFSPLSDLGLVRRFGVKWVDGEFSGQYVVDQREQPLNDHGTHHVIDLPQDGIFRAQFVDEDLHGLGRLAWTAVLSTDLDLAPTFSGELDVD